MTNTEFEVSNSWLESFRSRHNIVWHYIYDESNNVEVKTVWKDKLKLIIERYNIHFRALLSKTLSVKSEQSKEGKLSKEHLTIFLCANMECELATVFFRFTL